MKRNTSPPAASVLSDCAWCCRAHLVDPGTPSGWVCDGCAERPNASCGCPFPVAAPDHPCVIVA